MDDSIKKQQLEDVSKHSDKNERLSWNRKKQKMQGFIKELEPIQEEMLKLIQKKQPILDKIEELRAVMVKECIHPIDYLAHKETHIECKFCNSKIRIFNDNRET